MITLCELYIRCFRLKKKIKKETISEYVRQPFITFIYGKSIMNKPMFSCDRVYTFSYGFGFIFPSVSEYAFTLTIYSELWELITSSIIFS